MKKSITYLLLAFYLLAAFKPYLPVINYVVNYEFYKNVLCENKAKPELKCNGKCHLMKQMAATQDQDNDGKLPIPRLDLEKLPISTIEDVTSLNLLVFNTEININYPVQSIVNYSVYHSVSTPPPDKV